MRPNPALLAVIGLAAVATGAEARGHDARHYILPRYDGSALEGVLAAPNYDTRSLDRIIDARTAPGGDHIDWQVSDAGFLEADGTLERWSLGFAWPQAPQGSLAARTQDDGLEIGFTREWPAILSGSAGAYDFDLSPHAGVGLSNAGHTAEAGAMLRFGDLGYRPKDSTGQVRRNLKRFGMSAADGREFGGHGRWYLFAGASGTAVGMNFQRDGMDGGWRGMGLSSDTVSGFVTSAEAGVAWRDGPTQASIGYVRRKVRVEAPHPELYDSSDDAVALWLAIRPQD